MRAVKDIRRSIAHAPVDTLPKADAAVLHDLLGQLAEDARPPRVPWGIVTTIMRIPGARFAVAAVVLLLVGLVIGRLVDLTGPAYALEQTIAATRDMRWFHFEYGARTAERPPLREAWVERGPDGRVENIRVDYYAPDKEGRWGLYMVTVWRQGLAQDWHRQNNTLKTFTDENFTAAMLRFADRYDPKGALEHLGALQAKGRVVVEIPPPGGRPSLIVVTATYEPNTFLTEGTSPAMREVFLVDPESKLIQSVTVHAWRDGAYKESGTWWYRDYNEPFAPGTFDIDTVVPADAHRVDVTATAFGLEQGDLTKEQIAVKIVRDLFEALIAKDYDRAIRVYGVWHTNPETRAATWNLLRSLNVRRIVSIGDPLPPPPMLHMSALRVPCIIEIQKDGQVVEVQLDELYAAPVLGHRDRWHVFGALGPK